MGMGLHCSSASGVRKGPQTSTQGLPSQFLRSLVFSSVR